MVGYRESSDSQRYNPTLVVSEAAVHGVKDFELLIVKGALMRATAFIESKFVHSVYNGTVFLKSSMTMQPGGSICMRVCGVVVYLLRKRFRRLLLHNKMENNAGYIDGFSCVDFTLLDFDVPIANGYPVDKRAADALDHAFEAMQSIDSLYLEMVYAGTVQDQKTMLAFCIGMSLAGLALAHILGMSN